MAGANPSSYGGKSGNPTGAPKMQTVDREGEMVNPKVFGTEFKRRKVLDIATINPFGIFSVINPLLGGYATLFQSGAIGNDWTIAANSPNVIAGPSAQALQWWMQGSGLGITEFMSSLTGIGLVNNFQELFNVSAHAQDLYFPQDWTVIFENLDVTTKTINFGIGVSTGQTIPTQLTIPPQTVVRVTFELVNNNPCLVRLLNVTGTGNAINPIPGLAPPGFVVLDAVGPPATYSTTLIQPSDPNIVVTNPSGFPAPTTINFSPFPAAHFIGTPIDWGSALVWDPTSLGGRWEQSDTLGALNNPLRNAGFSGLLVGQNNSIQGPTNQTVITAFGDRTQNGVIQSFVGSTALAQTNGFSNLFLGSGATQSPNMGNRAFPDTNILNLVNFAAVNNNANGNGGYQYLGGAYTAGSPANTNAINFRITKNGEISQFLAMAGPSATALSQTVSGGICLTASRAEYKKNIADLTEGLGAHLFDSLKPVTFQYKSDNQDIQRIGFVVQDAEAKLNTSPLDHGIFTHVPLPADEQGNMPGLWDVKNPQDFDNRALIALLVQQVQQLKAEIAQIKKELLE